jgi:hypothetical protein
MVSSTGYKLKPRSANQRRTCLDKWPIPDTSVAVLTNRNSMLTNVCGVGYTTALSQEHPRLRGTISCQHPADWLSNQTSCRMVYDRAGKWSFDVTCLWSFG